jgi:hypothetical protein
MSDTDISKRLLSTTIVDSGCIDEDWIQDSLSDDEIDIPKDALGGGEDEDDNDLNLQGSATDDGLRDEEDVWQDLAQDFFKVEENVDEGNSYEEDQRT